MRRGLAAALDFHAYPLRLAVFMIRIAITQAAFDAIARTMPFGSVNFEAGVDDNGERYIWLPRAVVDRLRALRGPGESFRAPGCLSRCSPICVAAWTRWPASYRC